MGTAGSIESHETANGFCLNPSALINNNDTLNDNSRCEFNASIQNLFPEIFENMHSIHE